MSNKKGISYKKRISYKTLLCALVVLLSVVIYAPIIFTIHHQSEEIVELELNDIKGITEQHSLNLLAYAIESGNHDIIRATLDDLKNYHFIYSITVLDPNKNIIGFEKSDGYDGVEVSDLSSKEIPILSATPITKAVIENDLLTSDDLPVEKHVGTLLISYTDFFGANTALSPIVKALLFSFLLGIVTTAIFFVVLRSINKNFSNMMISANRLASGEKGIRLSENSAVRELSQFAESFNVISKELEKNWSDIEHQEYVYELKHNILQIAAHELRTPIGSIKTFLDIAIHHNAERRHGEVLSTLKKCFSDIDALDRHITSILCLSALENDSLTRNDDWVDVTKLFSDLDKQFSVKCQSKQAVAWNCFAVGEIQGSVFLDYDLVSIVVSNAIDNAVKYTNRGFVKVSYKIEEDNLFVTVHDSGVGLSEKDIEVLCSRPNQLQNHIKRKRDGWGIGMATMHKFADFLGGTIKIESKKDFGTKVFIRIPVECKSKLLAIQYENVSSAEETNEIISVGNGLGFSSSYVHNIVEGGLNILVIDNDAQHLSQMEELLSPTFLRRNDVQVTFCENSSDAIRHVEEFEFDCKRSMNLRA